ncbi:MAG: hypothetical protein WA323_14425 [Candidatus Nitrosopolaris sp.]
MTTTKTVATDIIRTPLMQTRRQVDCHSDIFNTALIVYPVTVLAGFAVTQLGYPGERLISKRTCMH